MSNFFRNTFDFFINTMIPRAYRATFLTINNIFNINPMRTIIFSFSNRNFIFSVINIKNTLYKSIIINIKILINITKAIIDVDRVREKKQTNFSISTSSYTVKNLKLKTLVSQSFTQELTISRHDMYLLIHHNKNYRF